MPVNKTEDKKLQLAMGNILRFGVLFSAAIVFIGGILYLLQTSGSSTHYKVFSGESKQLLGLAQIADGVMHLHGASIIQLGVLLLIATPVARVAAAMIGFLIEKDYLYVAISLVVLAIIIGSILSGKA